VEVENSTSRPQPYPPYEAEVNTPLWEPKPPWTKIWSLQTPLSEALKIPRLLHKVVPYGADQVPPFTYQGAPFALIPRPIHGWLCFHIPFALARGPSTVSNFYIPFALNRGLSTVYSGLPLPSLWRQISTA